MTHSLSRRLLQKPKIVEFFPLILIIFTYCNFFRSIKNETALFLYFVETTSSDYSLRICL